MQTLLLDTVSNDLVLDINGNIAIASEPYSLAQDAASAIKTFLGEMYYDTTVGVPYASILGKAPLIPFLKAQLVKAALTVPGIVSAQVAISAFSQRVLSGQIQVVGTTGTASIANFTVVNPQGVG